ncbi:MaoC family dehydratase N-terminal domain-containing protein [Sphingomonas oligophenolica]|uniref:MaoC family dehydratase N-terminal domain-containing protein n=1 Tax=Sphingomonas oligophenolica TaxID=301154 RepID=A0ABU9Y6D1_9SPHN
MTSWLDPVDLRGWIGAEEIVEDVITDTLISRFCATMPGAGDAAGRGMPAPRLIHFCLCQSAAPMEALGTDGHPARGGFLPPVPLPRRMWAASRVAFHGDLFRGDTVRRRSRIADVVMKEGRTGTLCFVTVEHVITVDEEVMVEDQQTIVYREQSSAPAPAGASAPRGESIVAIEPTPTLLFRYSALTFNGHRIHYDAPYARDIEGYSGLVVQGPLQATLLLQRAAAIMGREPDLFTFRSLSTLHAGDGLLLHAGVPDGGSLQLWTAKADGPVAMQAEACWR